MSSNQNETSGYGEVNGTRLWYEMTGQGHAVVLIHAGICDSRMWDREWQRWPQRYTVIRYDVRGFGASENPNGTFAHYADLHALLTSLGVTRTYLVAVSMAGGIALEYTVEHPDMVDGLVLVAAGHDDAERSAELREAWKRVDAAFEAGDIAAANEIELQLWVDGPQRTPDAVDPAVRELVREMNRNNFTLANDEAVEVDLDPSVYTRLNEITAPTLIITGDLDQPHVVASADLLQAAIPGAQKVVMHGTAHLPSMEQPAQFDQIVFTFFDGLQ